MEGGEVEERVEAVTETGEGEDGEDRAGEPHPAPEDPGLSSWCGQEEDQ